MIKQRERPNMDDRLRFFEHEGHRILLVDLSHCTAREVEEITRRFPDYVTTQPLGSTLYLRILEEPRLTGIPSSP